MSALVRLLVVDTGALDWRAMGVTPARSARRSARWPAARSGRCPVIFVTRPGRRHPARSSSRSRRSARCHRPASRVGFALSLLAGVIVAPFGEEILFRGVRHDRLGPRSRGSAAALVRGALFFAFAHVITITGAIGRRGVRAGGRRVRGADPDRAGARLAVPPARDVWASFGLHAAFNGILLVLAEVASRRSEASRRPGRPAASAGEPR